MRIVVWLVQLWQSVRSDDGGQTTAEYALVLLAAASLALLLIAWVAHSGKIGELFDTVFDHVIKSVK
jgi:hypothetical protein